METKDTFKIRQDKGARKKVECFIFFNKSLNRELAVHKDLDTFDDYCATSDVITGTKLFTLPISAKKVLQDQINERLEKFIAHYTVELIKDKLKEFEDIDSVTLNK